MRENSHLEKALAKIESRLDAIEQFIKSGKKKYLSVDELASYLGVSKNTIYCWSSKGILPKVRIGKYVRFNIAEINKLLNNYGEASEFEIISRAKLALITGKSKVGNYVG